MTERPILFSGPLVRAILRGDKTVTRRVMKPQPHAGVRYAPGGGSLEHGHGTPLRCPYGAPGDRLWVREAHEYTFGDSRDGLVGVRYAADGASTSVYVDEPERYIARIDGRKRPSIHMPRAFSRLTLEVTGVSVERVQEITPEDALAEGITVSDVDGEPMMQDAVPHFVYLWNEINGPRGYGWDANPWIWVVRFRRVDA